MMTVDVFTHGKNFRRKLLALAISPTFAYKYGALIIPDYFEAEDERDAANAIHLYQSAYDRLPTDPDDVVELCETEDGAALIHKIYADLYEYDLYMASSVAINWAKEQAAKLAVLDSVDDIKAGRLDAVLDRLEEARKVGDTLRPGGINVRQDISSWLYDLWLEKVPTGWVHMDIDMEGGLGVGELGFILAPSNRGKSMALVNIAMGAAGLGSGKNVLILTHEMHPKKYAKRFGARTLFRFPKRGDDLARYEADLKDRLDLVMPGQVHVEGGSGKMTTHQIEDVIKRLRDDGFKVDLLIDDYADLIISPKSYNDRRFELSATYEWLRALGGDYNFPVWTASQTNRGGYDKVLITVQDIAEDIGKVAIADVIVALCQTRDEADLERCRLFLAKVRDAKRGAIYDAKYYQDQQAIISIGKAKRREDDA